MVSIPIPQPALLAPGSKLARVQRKAWSLQAITVGFDGDSVLEGHTATVYDAATLTYTSGGSTTAKDAASLICQALATRWGVSVSKINRANSGRTVQRNMVVEFPTVLADKPDLLVISFGKNDIRSDIATPGTGFPRAQSIDGLRYKVRRFLTENPWSDVILLSENPYQASNTTSNTALQAYNAEMAALADELGVLYVDGYGAFPSPANAQLSDGTHPNDAGHLLLATAVLAEFPAARTPRFASVRAQPLVLPTSAPLPFRPFKYDNRGWVALSSVVAGAGTDRIKVVGTWTGGSGSPWVSSTAGDIWRLKFIGTDAAVAFNSSGVVDIYEDGKIKYTALDLAATGGSGTFRIPFTGATYPRFRNIMVRVVSGTVTVGPGEYARGPSNYLPPDDPSITWGGSGTWTIGEASTDYYSGKRTRNNTTGGTFTRDIIGTGLAVEVFRPVGGTQSITPTVNGTAQTAVDVSGDQGGTGEYGGGTIVSGLPYGRHTIIGTITIGTGAGNMTIGGFTVLDERRLEHPTLQEGYGKVADVVTFAVPFSVVPKVTLSLSSATGVQMYPTSVSKTGFTIAGPTGEFGTWKAEGDQFAF